MVTIKEKLAPTWCPIGGSKFLIGPLSPFDAIDFRNEVTIVKSKLRISGEGVRIAGNAVKGWEQVASAKGEDIPYSPEAYAELPLAVLGEIAGEVFKKTFLSEIERKNSSSPSTSG